MGDRRCTWCGSLEARLLVDSWTGAELCIICLSRVIEHVTFSPDEEGDNLLAALHEYAEDRRDESIPLPLMQESPR